MTGGEMGWEVHKERVKGESFMCKKVKGEKLMC